MYKIHHFFLISLFVFSFNPVINTSDTTNDIWSQILQKEQAQNSIQFQIKSFYLQKLDLPVHPIFYKWITNWLTEFKQQLSGTNFNASWQQDKMNGEPSSVLSFLQKKCTDIKKTQVCLGSSSKEDQFFALRSLYQKHIFHLKMALKEANKEFSDLLAKTSWNLVKDKNNYSRFVQTYNKLFIFYEFCIKKEILINKALLPEEQIQDFIYLAIDQKILTLDDIEKIEIYSNSIEQESFLFNKIFFQNTLFMQKACELSYNIHMLQEIEPGYLKEKQTLEVQEQQEFNALCKTIEPAKKQIAQQILKNLEKEFETSQHTSNNLSSDNTSSNETVQTQATVVPKKQAAMVNNSIESSKPLTSPAKLSNPKALQALEKELYLLQDGEQKEDEIKLSAKQIKKQAGLIKALQNKETQDRDSIFNEEKDLFNKIKSTFKESFNGVANKLITLCATNEDTMRMILLLQEVKASHALSTLEQESRLQIFLKKHGTKHNPYIPLSQLTFPTTGSQPEETSFLQQNDFLNSDSYYRCKAISLKALARTARRKSQSFLNKSRYNETQASLLRAKAMVLHEKSVELLNKSKEYQSLRFS